MSNELIAERQVTLFYTQSNDKKVVQTSARTWGELSNKIGENFSKSKVVLQESRLTLENTEAALPTGPFTLFVFPRQSKAGISNKDRDWSKMKYNELRSVASKLNKTKNAGISMGGSKDAIAVGVSKFYGGTGKFATAPAKTKTKVKAKATPIVKAKDTKKFPKAKIEKKPSKVVKKMAAKVVASLGDKLNEKIEKKKTEPKVKGMSTEQYDNVIGKLDTIISKLDGATPSMDEKELNKLSQLASSVRGTMQNMK